MRGSEPSGRLGRRQLLAGLVGLVAVGARRRTSAAPKAKRKAPRVSLDGRLSRAVFVALLGQTFTVSSGHQARSTIELLRIDDREPSEATEQFTVVFRGPHDLVLPEDSYTLRHHTAGSTTLFLQPAGHDGSHSYFEAPFNLLTT
jgi:hypothetical protein